MKNKDSWTNRKQALHNEVSAKQLPEGVGHRLLWEEFGVQGSVGIYRNLPDLSKHSKHSKHPMQAFTYQILQNLACNIHKQGSFVFSNVLRNMYTMCLLHCMCKHVYIYMPYMYIAFHCCTAFRPPCLDGTRKSPHTSTYRHQVAQSHLSRTQQKF